ncbi:hypothetical protein ACWGNZ_00830 [Sphingomonas zeae]|jgi:hypothetical protein
MPTITPPAFALDGTETIALNVAGRGGTVTLSQLQQAVRGQPIGGGAPNPPVGMPAIAAITGTEQCIVMNGATGGCRIATLDQLVSWSKTGNLPPFALATSGAGFGMPPVDSLNDGDALAVQQGAGLRGLTFDRLRAWLTA